MVWRRQTGKARVEIVVAIIGLIGVLGAALIGNWDKISPDSNGVVPPPGQTSTSGQPTAPSVSWKTQQPYSGDCRNRPSGTVCAQFDDGYIWLITGSVSGWETRVEGSRTVQVAISGSRRYEHVVETHEVRVIER